MKQQLSLSAMLLSVLSLNVNAADTPAAIDLSVIEAEERAQIIKELSFRLDTKKNCDQNRSWEDSGSGADLDGYFFIPKLGNNEYMIGGHASQKSRSKAHCVITVSIPADNPKEAPAPLAKPKEWQRIWTDKGSGATKDGAFWQAVPPNDNYRCLGSVSQITHGQRPNLGNYRCVHKHLTNKVTTQSIAWSDQGSDADKPVTIFRLPVTDTYVAIPKRANSTEAYDLKKDATSVPDEKTVEAILAQRLAPIKADIEAQAMAKAKAAKEQRKQEEAKQLAAAAEKKKAEAEKKKQAEAAKQKAKQEQLAAEKLAEEKRLAQEAEEAKQAEVEQQAQAVQEKAAEEQVAVETILAEAEKIKQEKGKGLDSAPLPPAIEVEVPEIIVTTETETSTPVVTTTETQQARPQEGKSLGDLIQFFIFALLALVSVFAFFFIIYKSLFGKKTPTGK